MTRNYDKDVPQEFLELLKHLTANRPITKQDFVKLCLLAIRLIDSGLSQSARDNISYHITGFWYTEKIINSDSLLSDIGGQFGEWEIPGYLDFNNPIAQDEWARLKHWVKEAENKHCP